MLMLNKIFNSIFSCYYCKPKKLYVKIVRVREKRFIFRIRSENSGEVKPRAY